MGRTKVDARVALAANIRDRAEHFGGLERLRAKTKLSTERSTRWRRQGAPADVEHAALLHGAGVPIPDEFLNLE